MAHHMPGPGGLHKGRGAISNRASRFQPTSVEWEDGLDGPSPITECRPVQATTIIARNNSPDVPFEQSINPYQGCEHGCIYCYARPTHAFLDLSPGIDFETRLTYKENAAECLERELGRKNYQCKPITLGANTDPYQPVEKQLGITRDVLEVLKQCNHPVSIITKGALICRDLELLSEMAHRGLCSVAISITTLDDDLKRRMEPRAASAAARFSAMRALDAAGVPVSLLFAPVIPGLNDENLESILHQAAQDGARSAAYLLLRLPLEVRDLFFEWLQEHYPLRAGRVVSLLRQCRDGNDYDTRFGHRMRGTGVFPDLLEQRFRTSCRKLGLDRGENTELRRDLFVPPRPGGQIDLFTA